MTIDQQETSAPRSGTRTVEADGFAVAVDVRGEGAPLITIHGAGGPHWTGGVDLLTRSATVYAVELPGFGAEVNDRTESAEDMARTVIAVADALGLETFDLLGTSMGGVVASWVAVLAGDRVTRLVLEAPGAFRPDRDPSSFTPEQMLAAFHAHPERKTLVQPDPEKQRRVWPLVGRIMGPLHDERLAAALAEVRVPTLVLAGQKDGLFGTETGAHYRRIMPMCSLAIVYDAAHDISGDRPEAFAAVVSDFLRRGLVYAVQERSTLLYP